jgi:ribosomal protein L37AE/L43A
MNPTDPPGQSAPPEWAPRLEQSLIRRLYEADAQGMPDEELLDEVGWRLRARCESFITAVAAARGRAQCPVCGQSVLHHAGADEILHCAGCGWEIPWRAYFKSFQHKQLSGAEAVLDLFGEFVAQFPSARTPQEKMLCIDRLIHGFHYNLQFGPTRAVGVNLIKGNYHEVVAFLDQLTYGAASTPGVQAGRAEWRKTLHQAAEKWQDARLKRTLEESCE